MLSEISQTEKKKNSGWYHLHVESKTIQQASKDNKYREKTSGYQLGEGREEGQFRGRGVRGTNY